MSKGVPSPAGSGMDFPYISRTAALNGSFRGILKSHKIVHPFGVGGARIFCPELVRTKNPRAAGPVGTTAAGENVPLRCLCFGIGQIRTGGGSYAVSAAVLNALNRLNPSPRGGYGTRMTRLWNRSWT